MRKCILLMILILIVMIGGMSLYNNYKIAHYYESIEPHSKLLFEIIEDTRDSACYKKEGIYKRIYRKYNYGYADSSYGSFYIGDSTSVGYYHTDVGDTVFMEFSYMGKYLDKVQKEKEE